MIYKTFLPSNIFSDQILFLVLSPKTDLHLQSPCTIINHRTRLKRLSTSIDKEFIKGLGPNYWTIWIISLEVVAAKNNDLKMLTFILVFSIVGLIGSGAQIIQDGQCNPDITLFNNFNIDNVSLINCKDAWKVISIPTIIRSLQQEMCKKCVFQIKTWINKSLLLVSFTFLNRRTDLDEIHYIFLVYSVVKDMGL